MEEQQALFETVQLADGTEATAAEIKLIDAITQEAGRFRAQFLACIEEELQMPTGTYITENIIPNNYIDFLNSKASIQIIRMLGGADLALEFIAKHQKAETNPATTNPATENIQYFFWILYYVCTYTPSQQSKNYTDILGDTLNKLHFETAKNPWAKLCTKRSMTAINIALLQTNKAMLQDYEAQASTDEQRHIISKVDNLLDLLCTRYIQEITTTKSPSTTTPQITAKTIFTAELLNKAAGALPELQKDGSYPKSLTITGTARKKEWKKNSNTGKTFLAPEINDKIVLMIPKEAKIETATPNDFFNIPNDMDIVSYVTAEILKCRSGKRPPDAFTPDKLPLIGITPTALYRALYRNPKAVPTKEALQDINNRMEKLNSRIKCRIDNDAEDKLTHKATSTKSFKPILQYHEKKIIKQADGSTYTIYYFGLYLSAFAGYAIQKGYYTTLDINKTLIYKLDAKGGIPIDERGNPTTQLEKMGETRRKLANYLERRILSYSYSSRKIIIDNMLDEAGIKQRMERSRIKAFIPTVLKNFKHHKMITSYKINEEKTEITYSIPRDTTPKELPTPQPKKKNGR